jgi:hypothetical protein
MNQAAVDCRRQAEEFEGKPEAVFLLRLASSFEELASKPSAGAASPTAASVSVVGSGL